MSTLFFQDVKAKCSNFMVAEREEILKTYLEEWGIYRVENGAAKELNWSMAPEKTG